MPRKTKKQKIDAEKRRTTDIATTSLVKREFEFNFDDKILFGTAKQAALMEGEACPSREDAAHTGFALQNGNKINSLTCHVLNFLSINSLIVFPLEDIKYDKYLVKYPVILPEGYSRAPGWRCGRFSPCAGSPAPITAGRAASRCFPLSASARYGCGCTS